VRAGGPTFELVAEDKIPAAYWKPQPPKLDRQGFSWALKNGTEIECAVGPQVPLSVRKK
jgi:hypothetical protein